MAWDQWYRDRNSEMPADWQTRRARVLERDGYICTWSMGSGGRCTIPATDVDHIEDPHDHQDANLRSLCAPHHRARTARQGSAARARNRYQPPQHPFFKRMEQQRGQQKGQSPQP